jgi:hypothetical protein
MPSEFSKSLYQSIWTKGKFTSEDYGTEQLDAELQEVREVLELLQNLPYQKPPCFCRVRWIVGEHDGPCQRARTLMEKLKC